MMTTTTDLQCDDVTELLPAYALGVLDSDEAIAVAGHLAECPNCRAALSAFESVVGNLNDVAPSAPPPGLRDRLLVSAVGHSVAMPPAETGSTNHELTRLSTGPSPRRLRFVAYGLAAAAVVLIAAVAVLTALLLDSRESRDEAVAAEAQLASYLSAGGEVTPMTSLSAANYGYSFGQGSLVTAPGKSPMIVVGGCPESDGNHEYRVWVSRDGDRTRIGVINVGNEGAGWLAFDPPEPLTSYDSIGVTMVTGDDARSDLFVGSTGPVST